MPIPGNMVRCQINATIEGGEQMVHTFFVKDVSPPSEGGLQELADGLVSKWGRFLSEPVPGLGATAGLFHNATKFNKVTVYRINPATGRAEDLAEAAFPAGTGGSGATALPSEVAVCATLLTGAPGRSARGRMYLGGFASNTLIATGRVNLSQCEQLAKALARFFREVRDIDVITGQADKWEPQVVSLKNTSARKITSVSIGDVFDVQRRRRNKLIETRQSALVN